MRRDEIDDNSLRDIEICTVFP